MKRALVADDEPIIQIFLHEVLTKLGYSVDVVGTGRAVYLLSSMRYDIIIVDFNMPEWNGVEAIELSRAFGNSSPIVLITGSMETPAGIPILRKPFTVESFIQMVNSITGRA
jgi:CheY-like chemotaxis protein